MKEVKGLGRGGLPGRKDDRTKENRLLGMTSSILMASWRQKLSSLLDR